MRSSASELFEIPKFFLFSEGGTFSGSAEEKDLNYKIVPHKVKDGESTLECSTWNGRLCIDKSDPVVKTYPLDQEGYDRMLADLEEEYRSRDTVKTHYQIVRERAEYLAETCLGLDDYERKEEQGQLAPIDPRGQR